ncbi:hypothetical protein C5167_033434 [Papaver somniferum]|uniref:Uncharacterized protein n=1 Tax=Papaver somniferum TaxID=3469 RepID=A0A4Y7KEA4_PAPSO|nr:hypothetical protein C5167_033434 [Papaver somniferum]
MYTEKDIPVMGRIIQSCNDIPVMVIAGILCGEFLREFYRMFFMEQSHIVAATAA